MPARILGKYKSYLENLTVRMQIGQTLGEEHQHECSIPQGCPFSMTLVALLMKPWMNQMRQLQVIPRTLADDLFFYSAGKGHEKRAAKAMDVSHQFFSDIAAKVADKKCVLTSTSQTTRASLRLRRWRHYPKGIPVVSHFRDLGTHITLDGTKNSTTMKQRIIKATKMTRALKRLKITQKQKAKIVRCNILTAGLYGSEAARLNKGALDQLTTAIVDAIGPSSGRRSRAMVFLTCADGTDLDHPGPQSPSAR